MGKNHDSVFLVDDAKLWVLVHCTVIPQGVPLPSSVATEECDQLPLWLLLSNAATVGTARHSLFHCPSLRLRLGWELPVGGNTDQNKLRARGCRGHCWPGECS